MSNTNKSILIILVKNPELGKAKTRLAASIGDKKALFIYKELLKHTKEITSSGKFDKAIFYSSFIDNEDLFENSIYHKFIQQGSDLGEKMRNAYEKCISLGYKKVCIIGSDCYELNSNIIDQGFNSLDNYNAVIGPALDGGYYLLGLSKVITDVYLNKNWSTDSVYSDTIHDFKENNFTFDVLPRLSDVDTVDDLGELKKLIE